MQTHIANPYSSRCRLNNSCKPLQNHIAEVWIEHSCKLLQNHLAEGITKYILYVQIIEKTYSTVGGVDLPPGNHKKIIQHKVGIKYLLCKPWPNLKTTGVDKLHHGSQIKSFCIDCTAGCRISYMK